MKMKQLKTSNLKDYYIGWVTYPPLYKKGQGLLD